MAKWAHSDLLDNGPQGAIVTPAATANRIVEHVIKAYASGDSYATVTGNSIGNVSLAAGDVPLSGGAGSARTMTVAAKSGVTASASSGATPNLHFAIVDSTSSKVLLVTDETSDQVVTSGNTINLPSWTYVSGQPT